MDISAISASSDLTSLYQQIMKSGQSTDEEEGFSLEISSSMIENNDEDGDGALSVEETDLSDDVFGGLDTNKDGVLSETEIQEAVMNGSLGKLSSLMQGAGTDTSTGNASLSAQGLQAYMDQLAMSLEDALYESASTIGSQVSLNA